MGTLLTLGFDNYNLATFLLRRKFPFFDFQLIFKNRESAGNTVEMRGIEIFQKPRKCEIRRY